MNVYAAFSRSSMTHDLFIKLWSRNEAEIYFYYSN